MFNISYIMQTKHQSVDTNHIYATLLQRALYQERYIPEPYRHQISVFIYHMYPAEAVIKYISQKRSVILHSMLLVLFYQLMTAETQELKYREGGFCTILTGV